MYFISVIRRSMPALGVLIFFAGCDAQLRIEDKPAPLLLRPVKEAAHPVAFYQGIPVAKGMLRWLGADRKPLTVTSPTAEFEAIALPAAYWPDGSVQWLKVEGIAANGLASSQPIEISIGGSAAGAPESAANGVKSESTGEIVWEPRKGVRYTLTPSASLVAVRKAKTEPSTDPDDLDRDGQYLWAVPLGELTQGEEPQKLQPVLRQQRVEEENSIYSVIVFQGNGGESKLGKELEWQLRVKAYHRLPLVRVEMTWVALWNPEEYALTASKWTITQETPWKSFSSLDGQRKGARLLIQNDHRGAGGISDLETAPLLEENPAITRDGIIAAGNAGGELAIGLHRFSRLGPNHLYGEGNRLEIAAWSERSGRALDLRRSTARMDYGTSDVDLRWNGKGVARTVYASLAFTDTAEEAAALARSEAARDYLWFANASDLGKSQALGPFSADGVQRNDAAMRGIQANMHFLRASRDHWRWNGWANFGDIRTNFALGDDPKRGLHAGHWVLNGRYGWRNTSGTISYGFMQTGMLLDDRELILAGLDNAEHIVDVDAYHGSFFTPLKGDQGGMRRRNRDHWSGNVQPQYSPNAGLYLSQWLSGNRRIADTLSGLRTYAARQKRENSVFPAQAWLFHYWQTHDPAALAEANRLLDESADWWREHSKRDLPGLSALYAGNFRRVSDGVHTLVQFHQATGDQRYLDALVASARAHPMESDTSVSTESHLFLLAYLRSQGVADPAGYERAEVEAAKLVPGELPNPATADYATLQNIVTRQLPPAGAPAYRESAAIAARAVALPIVLEQFGKPEASASSH